MSFLFPHPQHYRHTDMASDHAGLLRPTFTRNPRAPKFKYFSRKYKDKRKAKTQNSTDVNACLLALETIPGHHHPHNLWG